jgi:hypothetical protein
VIETETKCPTNKVLVLNYPRHKRWGVMCGSIYA